MLVFASPVPAAFSGLEALQPRYALERPSAEEQYFASLAEEHERAAALARKRVEEARRRQQQQRELEAQLRLQQRLATAIQVRTPQRSPYHTPARASFGRALPSVSDVILEFDSGDNESCDLYAERMHHRSQAATLERQKRAQEQNILRALFEEQRRTQAERVAELHRQRAEEAKAERERQRKAQQGSEDEQARRHLAARAADEERLRQFFQALVGAMGAESQGSDLERKNAIRRNSVPAPSQEEAVPAPAPAPVSAPTSPKVPERPASPAASVASDASDASLNSIALLQDKYNNLRASFQFPANLAFAPSTSSLTPASSPSLLYNPTNAPVHAYEHALTNLLTELDAVESFGDGHVRDVRRTLVRNVEAELEALEEKKRQAWRDQQAPAPAESVPAPVESAPAPVESVPTPVVEPTPATELTMAVESESTSTPAADSPNPVAWLATRLSQPSESEDDQVKIVRENLLARLAQSQATEADESFKGLGHAHLGRLASDAPAVSVPVSEPALSSAVESAVPEVVVASPVTEDQPEPTTTEVEQVVQSTPETETEPKPEPETLVADESPAETEVAPEPVPSSPVESVPESEVVSVTSPVPAAHDEQVAFVQVFPDSDSDVDTEADLASELAEADKKSTSGGEEFELI